MALRESMATAMNDGADFRTALEEAIADKELRDLHFLNVYCADIHTEKCKAISAPGYEERFASRGTKRKLVNPSEEDSDEPGMVKGKFLGGQQKSKQAQKRANQKKKKAEKKKLDKEEAEIQYSNTMDLLLAVV